MQAPKLIIVPGRGETLPQATAQWRRAHPKSILVAEDSPGARVELRHQWARAIAYGRKWHAGILSSPSALEEAPDVHPLSYYGVVDDYEALPLTWPEFKVELLKSKEHWARHFAKKYGPDEDPKRVPTHHRRAMLADLATKQ